MTLVTHAQFPEGARFRKAFLCLPWILLLLLVCSIEAHAQAIPIRQQLDTLLGSLEGAGSTRVPSTLSQIGQARVSLSNDGYLRHLGAPASFQFPTTHVVSGKPSETARNFLEEHRLLLGARSSKVDFRSIRSKAKSGRNYEYFQQVYDGIPVFGAQVIVQVNALGGVEYLLSDIGRETDTLDSNTLSIAPLISSAEAAARARRVLELRNPGLTIRSTDPELMLFDPSVVGSPGKMRLTWHFQRVYSEKNPLIEAEILLDAISGELVRVYPLYKSALDRLIYNHQNIRGGAGTLERQEGDSDTGDVEVDHAYHNLGYTYSFYWNHHNRDSIDNAGVSLVASVRYCTIDPADACPLNNAYGGGPHTYYGEGFAVDDVIAHEYTHGVTDQESGLLYENHSGAINESFSDLWGEFVDLTHNSTWDDDSTGVRWLLGEDLPAGAIRDMADPPSSPYNDPDRMGHPNFIPPVADPNPSNDYGGVHTNSGVNNKLCYLLTDGDSFNQEEITGMGIEAVADLYYEVQTNLLTSSADYFDLNDALLQAAVNLSWTDSEQYNLQRACCAVEIAQSGDNDVYVDGNWTGCEDGSICCPYNTVTEGYNAADGGDRLHLRNGPFNETLTFNKAIEIVKWGWGADVVIGSD